MHCSDRHLTDCSCIAANAIQSITTAQLYVSITHAVRQIARWPVLLLASFLRMGRQLQSQLLEALFAAHKPDSPPSNFPPPLHSRQYLPRVVGASRRSCVAPL